jgi:hypothetical protein
LRIHKNVFFKAENQFANGITLAEAPFGESNRVWEGDMNISRVSASARVYMTATAGALICTMFLGVVLPSPAAADDSKLRFKGGIGVIPVSSVTGCPALPAPCLTVPAVTVNRNVVRGVQPAGQIWVIDDLDARVSANGSITVKGKGLILAGGDSAGRAPALSVLASLICQPTAPFTPSLTPLPGVMLPPDGDFEINGMLSPVPPTPCASPMLLILNAANLTWFAVGIVRSGDD